jgi:hypothetical protein
MYVCLKIHSYRILTFECIVYNTCAHLCINTMHNYVLAHIFLHIMMVCAHPYFSLEYNTITFHQKRNCSDNRSWPLETGVGPLWSKLQPKVTLQYTMSQGELDLGIVKLCNVRSLTLGSRYLLYLHYLYGVWSSTMTCCHVTIALGDSCRNGEISVFSVHVVCSTARVIPQPDAHVLDS